MLHPQRGQGHVQWRAEGGEGREETQLAGRGTQAGVHQRGAGLRRQGPGDMRPQLLQQRPQGRHMGGLAAGALPQGGADLQLVDAEMAQPARCQAGAQQIEARPHCLRRHTQQAQQGMQAAVGHQQVPGAVHHQGRGRVVRGQQMAQGFAHRRHLGLVQAALGIGRGIAGREQGLVAFGQRGFQRIEQGQQHLAAGPRTAGLDAAEVALRHAHAQREFELADAALAAQGGEGGAHEPILTMPGLAAMTSEVIAAARCAAQTGALIHPARGTSSCEAHFFSSSSPSAPTPAMPCCNSVMWACGRCC
eukprot:Opistho-2@32194